MQRERRSSLVIGLNQVIRALEQGTLKLVLVDKSIQPFSLLEHLGVLCATRSTPVCALNGMCTSAIPELLGVRRVTAFGFKSMDVHTVFDELVQFISQITPPLYVPWLHAAEENNRLSSTISNYTLNTPKEESYEEHLPGITEMTDKQKSITQTRITREKNRDAVDTESVLANHEGCKKQTGKQPEIEEFPGCNADEAISGTEILKNNEQQSRKRQRTRKPNKEGQQRENQPGKRTRKTVEPMDNTATCTSKVGETLDNTGKPIDNIGKSTENTRELGNLKSKRKGLVEVSDAMLPETAKASCTSQEESKEEMEKKRKKSAPQINYMKPCIKIFDVTPKDKSHQNK
ncbi:uncharacterized protein [Montipora capricornis]